MISVGILLKKEREKRKISYDEISEETKIGVKYLKALESDNYTIFPGETYVIGFMRNYARALGLDPSEVINQYKSMKIGTKATTKIETPIEETKSVETEERSEKSKRRSSLKTEVVADENAGVMEVIELPEEEYEKKKKRKTEPEEKKGKEFPFFKLPLKEKKFINIAHLVIGGGAVIVLILFFILIKFIFTALSGGDKNTLYTELDEIKYLEFSGNVLQSDFIANEYYKIKLGEKTYNILFEKLTELSDANATPEKEQTMEFAFHINDITIPVKMKEDKVFDFDYDTKNDLKVKVLSFDNDMINARIDKLHSFIMVQSNETGIMADGTTNTNVKKKTVSDSKSKEGGVKDKIVLDAVVREKTYIKAFIDGTEQEGVIYYPKDKILLEANDVLQLKIGNAGGIIARINGKVTKLGKRGEIANKVIKWQRDPYDDSVYNLIIKDWQ
ncbi:MAG: helix-turn-helix domain-containing protein [Spirochaetes bacterium]|nr:helix-turn-helix domain-containing protein [Spirochaetota bacterium]